MKKKFTLALFINKLVNDLLITSLITFIIFQALESLKTGIISNYFDQNILIIIAAVCLIINVFLNQEKNYNQNILNFILYIFCISLFLILLFLNLQIYLYERIGLIFLLFLIFIIFYFKKIN